MNALRRVASAVIAFAAASHARALAVLFVVSLACFLPGLATIQPMDRDEPRFAQATKQMLESGDFVDIRFQDEARFKKPVGIYWMQAAGVAAAEALGFPDARTTIWLYRLPSVLGAVLAVLLAYWAGLVMLSRAEAFAAALLLASCVLLGVEARLAKTDAMLTATAVACFGVMARAWMLRGTTGPSRWEVALFWLAFGVSVLLKGPVVAMFVILTGLLLAWRDRSGALLRPFLHIPSIVLAVLIVLPWFVAIAVKSGGAFFAESVGKDMLGKVGSGQERHWGPPGAYIGAFVATFWPGSALTLLAIPYAWRHRRDDAVLFCLAWLIPSWIVFEFVPTKLPHYVLPLFPAVAILTVKALADGEAVVARGWRAAASLVLPAIPLLLILAGIAGALYLEGTTLQGLLPVLVAQPVLVAALVLAVMAWAMMARGAGLSTVVAAAAAAIVLYAGVYGLAWRGFRSIQISPRLAEAVRAVPCQAPRVVTAGYREPSLVFLVGTDLEMADGAGAARFLGGDGCRVALVESRLEKDLSDTATSAGISTRLVTRLHGFNINGGRWLDIGVYFRDTPRS